LNDYNNKTLIENQTLHIADLRFKIIVVRDKLK
jgi:hypothetical protein